MKAESQNIGGQIIKEKKKKKVVGSKDFNGPKQDSQNRQGFPSSRLLVCYDEWCRAYCIQD